MKCPHCSSLHFRVDSLVSIWRQQDLTFYADGAYATYTVDHEALGEIETKAWRRLTCDSH